MKNKMTGELSVCGYNAVRALCDIHPERVIRLYFSAERAAAFGDMCKRLAAQRKTYRLVDDEQLKKLSRTEHHQGVVARIASPRVPTADAGLVNAWMEKRRPILALEGLGNSHNLGAIVRSAAFFGIQDILLVDDPKTDPLSTSAYRVAEGGMELVALSRCADLGGLFGPRRSEFPLIGADQRGALSVFDEKALPRTGRAFALLLGNEERGLSDAARRACSSTVRIPGSGGLESLNVAQAAAVFMALMFGRRS